jgi:hypothetical protein
VRRPLIPAPPYRGGCLCGAVRYSLNARPLAVNACHCDDCKKLSGATNLLMVMAERASFAPEKGDVSRYTKRADSGRNVDILRCANCGTRLWHEPQSAPNYMFIAVGTLDDPNWAIPTSHIWVEKASPRVTFEEDAIKVKGQPGDRQTLIDAFARVYPA